MDKDKSHPRLFAVLALALFIVGLFGPFLLLPIFRFGYVVGLVLIVQLLALVFGIMSWSEKPGKVAAKPYRKLFIKGVIGLVLWWPLFLRVIFEVVLGFWFMRLGVMRNAKSKAPHPNYKKRYIELYFR